MTAGLVLMIVAAAKLAGALVPLAVYANYWPWTRPWQILLWFGAAALFIYGIVNIVGAWLVLAGAVDGGADGDRAALSGHAVLWDPLFAAWGGRCSLLACATSRRRVNLS